MTNAAEEFALNQICRQYDVPAKKGGRVEYTGEKVARFGTIKGHNGSHLMILLDGNKHPFPFHPTWELRYLEAEDSP